MNRKKALVRMLALVGLFTIVLPAMALASEEAAGPSGDHLKKFGLAIGAGLGMGLAVFGGGMGQGKAAAAALDGIARNPGASDKMFVPMIIGLALIESLVIYMLIIAFILSGKI